MRLIIKQTEPKELTHFRNSKGTWDTFSLSNGKKEVKVQLLKEQRNLCAYCTSAISFGNMKVEHRCSRKRCPTR